MADPLTRTEFARRIMTGIDAAGAADRFRYDEEAFAIHDRQTGLTFELQDAYRAYTSASEERQPSVLEHYLDNWLSSDPQITEDFELAVEQLMPVVRPRWFFQKLELERDADGLDPMGAVFSTLAEHYAVALVADFPRKISFVLERHLEEWDVSFATAARKAMDNLASRTMRISAEQVAGGVWMFEAEDAYTNSRLVLAALWDSLELDESPVVFMPGRDVLLWADSADTSAVARAALFCLEVQDQLARPQATFALIRERGRWRPFIPEAAHAAAPFINALHYQSRTRQYAEQKPLLEGVFETTGENWYVSSYAPVEGRDDRWRSVGLWPSGRAALLPEIDLVVFSGWPIAEGQPFDVRLRDCQSVLGRGLQQIDVYPPRWSAHPDVTEAQLRALFEARVGAA